MAKRKKNRSVKVKGSKVRSVSYAEERSPSPKKKKRRGSPINVLTVVLFAIIMIYLVKYAFDFATGSTTVAIETVDYGTIDIPNAFNGLIVRDEYVETSESGGEPTFNYGEGDKVKKNALVCTVREGETADNAEDRLRTIDESIIETQKNRVDISKYKDDITKAENSILSSVESAQAGISAGSYNDVYTMRNAVQTQMDIRTDIWINENSESSDSLASQRRTYQTQISKNTENLTAADSGILVLSCDGNEEKFTPDTLETVTKKDTTTSYDITYLSKTTAVEKGSPAFKIVRSNTWYICAYIDNAIASEWEIGDTKTIRAVVDKTEKTVDVTIDSMTAGETETCVVFKTNSNVQDFLSERSIEFYITDSSYEGLKIPNSAIVEKTFIKIPASCVMESLNGYSVVKRTDGKDDLINVEIESQDEEFAYIRQDFENLKIGDVILNGTGENASEYKLSEVSTKVGVLTANSAYAKFASISVLGQNSQYTIADAAESSLKAYDKIITNTSEITEGDEIY